MRMRVEDARVVNAKTIAPGTLVRPLSSDGFSEMFQTALAVEFNGGVRGLLALDGSSVFRVFLFEDEYLAVRQLPRTSLLVQGIDGQEPNTSHSDHGALTVRDGGGPVIRAMFNDAKVTGPCYVDIATGKAVKLGNDESRDSFLAWQLVAVDSDTDREEVVASGPGFTAK